MRRYLTWLIYAGLGAAWSVAVVGFAATRQWGHCYDSVVTAGQLLGIAEIERLGWRH